MHMHWISKNTSNMTLHLEWFGRNFCLRGDSGDFQAAYASMLLYDTQASVLSPQVTILPSREGSSSAARLSLPPFLFELIFWSSFKMWVTMC
ncbi:hypothetical protein TNCV_445771 [Trichonephila clavipes]|nr:hypothetical protein TNCV_445771 [Trichonephila clavipes]